MTTPNQLQPLHETLLSPEQQEIRGTLYEFGRTLVEQDSRLHISVDIEADGPSFGLGNIRSIGGVTPDGETFYTELKPLTDKNNPPQHEFCETHGLEITRLSEEGEDVGIAMQRFMEWTHQRVEAAGKAKPVMVGQAIGWDNAFINSYAYYAGVVNPYGLKALDICSESYAGMAEYDFGKTGKNDFPKIIWPDKEFPHHALEDAIIQMQLHYGTLALDALQRDPERYTNLIDPEQFRKLHSYIEQNPQLCKAQAT